MNNIKQQSNSRTAVPQRSTESIASAKLHLEAIKLHAGQYPDIGGVFTPVSTIAKQLKCKEPELRLLIEGRGLRIHFDRYVCVGRLKEILGMNAEVGK